MRNILFAMLMGAALPAVCADAAPMKSLSAVLKNSPNDFGPAMNLLFYRMCAARFGGFDAGNAVVYSAWRERHRPALARLESSPEFKAWIDAALAQMRVSPENTMNEDGCGLIVAGLEPPPSTPATSPEETWRRFMEALRDGDSATALSYLTPQARYLTRHFAGPMPNDTRRFVDALSPLTMYGKPVDRHRWVGRYRTASGQLRNISFENQGPVSGWQIDEMFQWD